MRRRVRERRRVWGREGEKAAARPVPSATPLPLCRPHSTLASPSGGVQ